MEFKKSCSKIAASLLAFFWGSRAFEKKRQPFGSERFWSFGEAERWSMPEVACDCLSRRSFRAKGEAKTKPKPKRSAASEWLDFF
jgi:hypothetical protein